MLNFRQACGVPADLVYQTKPEIALKLLQAMVARNKILTEPLRFRWVAADALYGDSIAFRDGVAELDKWYFTAIKSTLQVWLQAVLMCIYLPGKGTAGILRNEN